MKIKTIRDINLAGKCVVLRVDFNVPVKKGKVIDNTRIVAALPTINFLLKQNCQVIILAHLGRPEGKRVTSLSLEPVFKSLQKFIKVKVKFVKDKLDLNLIKKVKKMSEPIILLENIRFEKGEDRNDDKLGKLLSGLGEVFVSEGFSVSHRTAASVVAITKYLDSYAGLNLADEVINLSKALKPKKPSVAIVGGVKLETKVKVLKNLLKIYDKVLVGGALANTFMAAKGYQIGQSLYGKEEIRLAKSLLKFKKLVLPKDFIVSKKGFKKVRIAVVSKNKNLCAKDEMILDLGPATIMNYALIIKKAQAIVWNGPLGYIEEPKFRHASVALCKIMASRSSGRAFGVAGGGETLLILDWSKMKKYFDFVSTAGGAMLEFLEGKVLPGIKPLLK